MINFNPNQTSMTKINVNYISGFSEAEKERANMAIDLLRKLINTEEFAIKVREIPSFTRNTIPQKTGGEKYYHEEILNLIRSGEDLNSEADGVINLKLKLYDGERSEVGHTSMSTLEISTFRGYFADNDIAYYASHLMHEYMHVIGFTHGKFDMFKKRHKTVPYRIGKTVFKMLTANADN